jgi:hypothetical protein
VWRDERERDEDASEQVRSRLGTTRDAGAAFRLDFAHTPTSRCLVVVPVPAVLEFKQFFPLRGMTLIFVS